MKIVTVVGARPQFIKAATVSRILRKTPQVTEILVHTGQHYDDNMSAIFFDSLEIPKPEFNLSIGSGFHGVQTGRMLAAVEEILIQEKPDYMLVYGDTNSTLAGALAAAKLHIPVAHVEAGLRSFNRQMPEEINRVLTDHISSLLFAPTKTAVNNLISEGISPNWIHFVGDVMLDAALFYGDRAQAASDIVYKLDLVSRSFILATIHRAENTDDPKRLKAIIEGLLIVNQNIPVVWPIHPRTKAVIETMPETSAAVRSLQLIDPVGYLDMVMLEKNARLIVTDSGGVQKEAYFYRVPCVTLRNETEWVELVNHQWNKLVTPTSPHKVAIGIQEMLMAPLGEDVMLYGDGSAAVKIVQVLTGLGVNA